MVELPRPKVLVVEDELILAMDLCLLLEDAGYRIVGPAATVASALSMVESDPPDACVLDLNLRGEQSSPVAQVLKQRNIPFVLATAYLTGTMDRHPAFERVINVGKPIPSERLLLILEEILARRPPAEG